MARRPLIVGLTGSMGMGKTTVARMFRRLGVPTYDADTAVHRLFAVGGAAVAPIAAAFPGVARDGAIDRARLSARVVSDAAALSRLEGLVHPLVRRDQARFVSACAARGHTLVLLDIPLLFESGGARRCDWVVVVSAPARVQRARVLARPAMTEDKFAALLARQMSDDEKRARADFIVPTGCPRRYTAIRVRQLVRHLQ